MSSQNKLSFWQRIKNLLLTENKTGSANVSQNEDYSQSSKDMSGQSTTDSHNASESHSKSLRQPVDKHGSHPYSSKANTDVTTHQQAPSGANVESSDNRNNSDENGAFGRRASTETAPQHSLEKESDYHSAERKQSKFITLSNLDDADTMKQRSSTYRNSDKPITDAILDFLEASDLSYYYHDPEQSTANRDSANNESKTADSDAQNTQNNTDSDAPNTDDSRSNPEQPPHKSKVHHISMAMRYYSENSINEQAYMDDSLDDIASSQPEDLEWGCVIRVHEHTQLVAMYGILPFQLPASHLQAGITLATQLNYDMMLGCVEIDIRDGEIRFKNSLDMEPIINASGGIVPPTVISYLLKGIMAMTSSFAPLFTDLLNSDPEAFELQSILDELHKAKANNTFFLATTTPQ